MSNDPSDIRNSPKSGLVIIALNLIMLPWAMFFMSTKGALQHPVGWVILIGMVLWFVGCLYGLRIIYFALTGRKNWPKTSATRLPNRQRHMYAGDPPYFLKPKSRNYIGAVLPAIVAVVVAPPLAIGALGVFLVEEDQGSMLFGVLFFGSIFFAAALRAIHQFLKARFLNRIRISLSEPARPGSSFTITVNHPELPKVERMAVDLVLEEVALNSDGDPTTMDVHFAATLPICRLTKKMTAGGNVTSSTKIQLPISAVPTFNADHNKINWFLLVRADLKLWEGLEQRYPLPVIPADDYEGAYCAAKKENA